MHTSSALIELAARILCDGRDPNVGDLARHAGIAYAIAGLLLALPVHAARGQLYLPADLMARYGAEATDAFAGNATTELRAVLAELRLWARHHLGAARGLLNDTLPELAPALLPVALVRPALDRMERRFYQPLRPTELPMAAPVDLWRAARGWPKRSDLFRGDARRRSIDRDRPARGRRWRAAWRRSCRCRAAACRLILLGSGASGGTGRSDVHWLVGRGPASTAPMWSPVM
jgi:hypothetical protein